MTDNDLNGFQNTGVGMYDTYVPFQTGWTIEEYRAKRCEYCGKPAQHANCHAHEKWCPYSCGYNNVSVGSELALVWLTIAYVVVKRFLNGKR